MATPAPPPGSRGRKRAVEKAEAMEPAKMASPKSAPKDAQVPRGRAGPGRARGGTVRAELSPARVPQVMAQILKDMGITEYEPRVINQMLEFAYRERRGLRAAGGAEGAEGGRGAAASGRVCPQVPHRPVLHLAAAPRCKCCGRAGRGARRAAWGSPPRPQFLLDIARQKNQTPLPLIKPYSGPRLPPDRYCLTAPNYRLKSLQKKVRGRQGGVR
ncbi:TAF9B RNA polymerase II, TATA box binding protein (TBP)-associated factor, 31kDa, transcript variant X1 [Aix galericulata]|nr:TAF9B RNA polymerase II, TATA box binding protein (TBP)-associated factor, 31kDa, transcript variant X1 [Aix galericulata]